MDVRDCHERVRAAERPADLQLARGAYRLSFILLGGALCQLALFGVFNESPEELLTVSIAVAGGLLIAHELFVMRALPLVVRSAAHARAGS